MAVGKKTGGRKKGSLNKRTIAQLNFDPPLSPLEFLTKIYLDESETTLRRVEAAKAAAPYRHHRLGSKEYLGLGPLMTPQPKVEPEQIMRWMIEDLDPTMVKLGEELRGDVSSIIAAREYFAGVTLTVEDAIESVFGDLPELRERIVEGARAAGTDLQNFTWLILAAPRRRPDICPPFEVTFHRSPADENE